MAQINVVFVCKILLNSVRVGAVVLAICLEISPFLDRVYMLL